MPTETIGDNTGDDYSGTEDAELYEASPTNNDSSGGTWYVSKYGSGDYRYPVLKFSGIDSLPDSITVTSAALFIYMTTQSGGTTHTITLRRILRDWVEGEVTYNIWKTSNNWTTGGALSNGNDRASATSGADGADQNTGEYKELSTDNAQFMSDIEDMASGSAGNYGWHLERTDGADDSNYQQYISSEGTEGSRPYISLTYTTGGGDRDFTATLATMVMAELNTTINATREVDATLATTVMAKLNAVITQPRNLTGTLATMAMSKLDTTINATRQLAATEAAMVMAKLDSTVTRGTNINTNLATMAMAKLDASLNRERGITGTLATMAMAALNAQITASSDREFTATLATMDMAALNTTVNATRQANATLATMVMAKLDGTVTREHNVVAVTKTMILTRQNAIVNEGAAIVLTLRRGLLSLFRGRR